ncbi:MAG: chromate transporter [Spirochaetales bacterium]|nr:chromate transporter [Spirochaetales bacterium]
MIYLALFTRFFRIGLFTLGGGYAMIPLIQHEISTASNLLTHDEVSDVLLIAQSAPGPIAVNTAVMVGYKALGTRGALATGLGVILPSFLVILSIALWFMPYTDLPQVVSAFRGILGLVVSLIVFAAWKVSLHHINWFLVLGTLAWLSLMIFVQVNPYLIVLLSGASGLLYGPLSRRARRGESKE